MKRTRNALALAGTAILILALVSGCSLLLDRSATGGGQGWCIQLNIRDPGSSRAITVTEHEVTGLTVEVLDPGDTSIQTVQWDPADGPSTYLVPVTEAGQYTLVVTHTSDDGGQVVQATETATFNIQPMIITVIDIVPGAIGTIGVNTEGEAPPAPWILGYWVDVPVGAPFVSVLEVREDGTFTWWSSYDASGESWDQGTWSLEGDVLTVDSMGGPFSVPIVKVSDDHWYFEEGDGEEHLYRRGTQPGGWVFDRTPIELDVAAAGAWTDGTVADQDLALYSFEAPGDGTYQVFWKEAGDPSTPVYDADVSVSAYLADQETPLFVKEEDGYDTPHEVSLASGQLIYLIVEPMDSGESFGLRVEAGSPAP
jgi:hypothetical protein